MLGQDEVSAVSVVKEEKGQNLNTHGVVGGGSSVKALQEKLLLKKNVPPPPPLVIPRRREKPLVFVENGTRSHSTTGSGTKRSPQNARTMQELVELRSKKLAQFIQTQFTTMAERNAAMRGAEEAILAQLKEKQQLQQHSQQGLNLTSKEVISKLDQIYLNLRQEQALANKKIRQYKEGLIHQHSYTVTTTANKANATLPPISSSSSVSVNPSPLPPRADTRQGDDHSADDAAGHYLASSTSAAAAATFLDFNKTETTPANVLPFIPSDHTLLHHKHVDSALLPLDMDTTPCWLPTVLAQDEDAAIRRAEEMVRQMAQEVDWWETTTVSSNTSYFLDELSEIDDDISTLSPFTTNTMTNSTIHDKTIYHGFQKESTTVANYPYATLGTSTSATMPSLKDEDWITYWSEDYQREYFYNTRTQKVAWFIPSSAEKMNKETVPEEEEEKCNNTQNKSFIYDDGTVDDSELVPVKDYTKKIVQSSSTETEQQEEHHCSPNARQYNQIRLTVNITVLVTLLIIPFLVLRYGTGDCCATLFLRLKHASKELVSTDNTLPTKNQDNKLNVSLEHEVVDESSPVEKQGYNRASISSSSIKPKKRVLPVRKEKTRSLKQNLNINQPSMLSKAAATPATEPGPSILKDIPPSLTSVVTEEPGCMTVSAHSLSYFSFTYDVRKSALADVKAVGKGKEKEALESTISLSAAELMNAGQDRNSGQRDKVKKNNENTVKRPKGCYIPLSWLISSNCRLLAKQEPLFDVNSPEFMKY
jgi:hypothetical protein